MDLKNSLLILITNVLGAVLLSPFTCYAASLDGRCKGDLSCGVSSPVVTSIDVVSDSTASSQNVVDEQDIVLLKKSFIEQVYFPLDESNLNGLYLDNDAAFRRFYDEVRVIGWDRIDSIEVVSYASPEGAYQRNMQLSHDRSQAMKRYIEKEHPELMSRLTLHAGGESWTLLRELVKNDTKLSPAAIEAILAVIDADIDVEEKKLQMRQLPDYAYLYTTYYPIIRKSMLCVIYFAESRTAGYLVAAPACVAVPAVEVSHPVRVVIPAPDWVGHLYVKTNAAAWGMGISNIGVEVDVAPHWSVALPIYYSAWNYFRETTKFRTFSIQPEARYWLGCDNVGFYAGVHLNMAYYNFALGEIRYQDHNGCSPAWGGGVNVGYRMPISKNNRWHLEFNLGAGVHSLYYDTFHNTPSTKDGLLIESVRDTYWGIDQVGITFSYRFDLFKKGGSR